jgi:hypothetical protein
VPWPAQIKIGTFVSLKIEQVWNTAALDLRSDARSAPRQWVWSAYTSPQMQGNVTGDRDFAALRARRVIETWCDRHPGQCSLPPMQEQRQHAR